MPRYLKESVIPFASQFLCCFGLQSGCGKMTVGIAFLQYTKKILQWQPVTVISSDKIINYTEMQPMLLFIFKWDGEL